MKKLSPSRASLQESPNMVKARQRLFMAEVEGSFGVAADYSIRSRPSVPAPHPRHMIKDSFFGGAGDEPNR